MDDTYNEIEELLKRARAAHAKATEYAREGSTMRAQTETTAALGWTLQVMQTLQRALARRTPATPATPATPQENK